MLILSISLIFLVGTFRPQPLSSAVQKEKFWADKVHSKKTYEVIVAGDSRVYRGIDPKTLSGELGNKKVLNFGFSSGGFNSLMFEEINKRLPINASERIIILGLSPYSLTPKAQENRHFLQERDRPSDEVFKRRFINPFLKFFDPLKPSDIIQSTDSMVGYHERFRKDGWVESYKIPSNPKEAIDPYRRDFQQNKVSDEVLGVLFGQIAQWSSQEILVFAFRIPTTPDMETLENNVSGFVEDSIRNKIEENGGIWIDIEDRYGYTSYDGSHLTATSAVEFTKYLGKRLREKLKPNN